MLNSTRISVPRQQARKKDERYGMATSGWTQCVVENVAKIELRLECVEASRLRRNYAARMKNNCTRSASVNCLTLDGTAEWTNLVQLAFRCGDAIDHRLLRNTEATLFQRRRYRIIIFKTDQTSLQSKYVKFFHSVVR